jgi:hypothetical protein
MITAIVFRAAVAGDTSDTWMDMQPTRPSAPTGILSASGASGSA